MKLKIFPAAGRCLYAGVLLGLIFINTAHAAAAPATPAAPTATAKVKIRIGTIAPKGTTYANSLTEMSQTWQTSTKDGVEGVLYPGGAQGSEPEMVGLMKSNSLQAALLTAVGLAQIEPAVSGLQSIPMGFRDFAEVDYVGEKLQPMLEKRLLDKGFVVLFWTDAGWVRYFSTKPVVHPDDLRKLKVFALASNPGQIEVMKNAHFANVVPLEVNDLGTALQTGLVEAMSVPPIFALTAQLDKRAPYMLDLNWAPLVGAFVIRKQTWDQLPPETQAALRAAAVIAGQKIKADGRKEADDAVITMQKRGLKVTPVPPELEAEWRTMAEAAYPQIRGNIVPADIFDETMRLLKEYRDQNKK
jgi:TRAP-type C4-dicarboxylate transport system substrate-binding protein